VTDLRANFSVAFSTINLEVARQLHDQRTTFFLMNTSKSFRSPQSPRTKAHFAYQKVSRNCEIADNYPKGWAQFVKLWKQHDLTVRYGKEVAGVARYVGSLTVNAT
jgi:hypothetical protein